ncbi:class II aldolase [Nordella sp. HKS 07]|uniref:class II aldolase/adducin family protein n=1 Tax=Nordella sp. HKS 07 TaxID=2712222 RepID=UPI0013E1C99C|nr:class II aldolase/adducin family protein [Nordella sp. HKS 07]QIG47638.1 class II aldolase [Nordella sp. HKS 07]
MDEMTRLMALSAKVGADPLLVQAAGGNTSLKQDGTMWIKASGTWLQHAHERNIFVPVALDPLLAALERDDPACESCTDFVRTDLNSLGLRPSIETTVHASFAHRIVLHVHCVETISWAVRADAEAMLAPRLAPFHWAFIPYRRPGLPLATEIRKRLKGDTNVLVLGNHGLVVAAETVAAAEALLHEVVRALVRPARAMPLADLPMLEELARDGRYELAADPSIHALAVDPVSLAQARKGTLYPDHIVFLGAGIAVAQAGEDPRSAAERIGLSGRPEPKLIAIPGKGVLLAKGVTPAALAMARCLADVTARLSENDPAQVLSREDELALVNWDAEKYRQSLPAS